MRGGWRKGCRCAPVHNLATSGSEVLEAVDSIPPEGPTSPEHPTLHV